MIDKSQGFNDVDAPPPYQHALRSSSDLKVNLAPPSAGSPSGSRSSSRSTLSKRQPNARTKPTTPTTSSRWFPTSIFGLSKTAKQVRSATQGLLRDLLWQARPCEHEWASVLGHCADTCSAHGLNFSALIQEPFVEGHLPIYWAILKRPTSSPTPAAPAPPVKGDHTTTPSSSDHDAFVLAIMDASIPLGPQSIADARLACMTVSDNALFQRLGRRYEAFSPRSGTDRVLLGGADAVDTVDVMEMRGSSGAAAGAAFTVRFSITQFQLRMRVSKLARIEFIARGTYILCPSELAEPLLNCVLILFVFRLAQGDCGTFRFLSRACPMGRICMQAVPASGLSRLVFATVVRPRGSTPASLSSIDHPHQHHPRRMLHRYLN